MVRKKKLVLTKQTWDPEQTCISCHPTRDHSTFLPPFLSSLLSYGADSLLACIFPPSDQPTGLEQLCASQFTSV